MKENHLVWLCDFLQSLIQILNTTEWHLVPCAYDNHMKTSSYQLTIEIKNWKTEFTCLHVDLFSKILEEMDFSTCKTFWYLTNSRSVGNSNGLFFFFPSLQILFHIVSLFIVPDSFITAASAGETKTHF